MDATLLQGLYACAAVAFGCWLLGVLTKEHSWVDRAWSLTPVAYAVFFAWKAGFENPRVALMNVGGEEQKGTSEMKVARDLLRGAENLNFIGYVEGRGVFDGDADVVITDGVVGNVMLKLAEGLSRGLFQAIAQQVLETDPELAIRLEPVVKAIYAKHDYHEYGGAPLLGVNGTCLISHGSSVARTMMNAILRARQFVLSGMNEVINARLETIQEPAQ